MRSGEVVSNRSRQETIEFLFVEGDVESDKGLEASSDLLDLYDTTVVVDPCVLLIGRLVGMLEEDPCRETSKRSDLFDAIPAKGPVQRRYHSRRVTTEQLQALEPFTE